MTTFVVSRPLKLSVSSTAALSGSSSYVEGPPAATGFTLTGSTTGTTGTPTTFTITPNGVMASTVVVTIAATNAGSVTPTTRSFAAGSSAAQTFTVNRSSDGTSSVSITNNGGLSNFGTPISYTTTTVVGLTWSSNLPSPLVVARGSVFNLAPYISDPSGELGGIEPSTALPSGVSIVSTPSWRISASSGATIGSLSGLSLRLVRTQEADYLARIAATNAVWHHSFDADAEMTQFRWTNGYSGGNDPLGNGSGANFITRVASGGADGGGFLRATYPAGSTAGRGSSSWWRPFNPLTGSTNGRGTSDPGAGGTLTPVAWNVSDGSSTLLAWGQNATNPGWYGHATAVAANPTKFQGTDYYLQIRVRRADTPGAPPDSAQFTYITGKNVWLTTTNASAANQELVTMGQSNNNGDVVGVYSRHNAYLGQNFTALGELVSDVNPTITISNLTLNWRYSGGWDTLLYHITPGTQGGTGTNRTRVEVWAQHDPALYPAEAGIYTKIWDVQYTQVYDTGSNSSGSPNFPGWNALILGCYHNGSAFATSFNFDYDQIIFSKSTIPAPNV